jgi:two-component system sensor histidine kinase MtrB
MTRLGLRARVTVLFAGGALVLTTALAVTTYEVVRHNLVIERQRSAVRAAYFDAAVVRQGISSDDADVVAALRALDTGQGRRPLIRRQGTWFARTADDNLTRAVPAELLRAVSRGVASVQVVRVGGAPALVVGIPLPGSEASFFEVQSLSEVQSTLRTVATALALVALLGTGAAATLSWAMSRRALSPLSAVTQAARRIREGDLDVTIAETSDPDLVDLTNSFNDMVLEVKTRMERERRFAADVSHELRSPLQTLAAASQVLINRRDTFDSRAAAAATLLEEEIARFTALVQSLLELARADQSSHRTESDVPALLELVAARHHLALGEGAVGHGAETWWLDEARMERILDNLLDNARKYGGGAVALTARCEEDELVIDVDDARGRNAHTRGTSEGAGLGLSLVAGHMAAMSGWVEVLDRPTGGGRFRLHLPRGEQQPLAGFEASQT